MTTSATTSTVICDIDGTLAKMAGRGPFEWDRVDQDQPNAPVIAVVTALYLAGHPVILVTGRMEQCRGLTSGWLQKHLPFVRCQLHMRPDDDYRKDAVLKRQIYDQHLAGLEILCVFDDRAQTVEMWRELGLACFQVAEGNF